MADTLQVSIRALVTLPQRSSSSTTSTWAESLRGCAMQSRSRWDHFLSGCRILAEILSGTEFSLGIASSMENSSWEREIGAVEESRISKMNCEPLFFSDSHLIDPPIASLSFLHIMRPSPTPRG